MYLELVKGYSVSRSPLTRGQNRNCDESDVYAPKKGKKNFPHVALITIIRHFQLFICN